MMQYVLSILIGYLLGCSSMSYYLSKFKKADIKTKGSRNYGASNTAMFLGMKAGVLVFVHDFAKAAISVVIANLLFPSAPYVGVVAGCASVVGHIFPFYLKFDGGKGYAPFIGMSIALYPLFGIIAFLISVVLALLSDYVVSSTFSFIATVPLFALFVGDYVCATILFVTTLLIVWKHKENIKNLVTRNGKEARISCVLKKNKENNGIENNNTV